MPISLLPDEGKNGIIRPKNFEDDRYGTRDILTYFVELPPGGIREKSVIIKVISRIFISTCARNCSETGITGQEANLSRQLQDNDMIADLTPS